MKTLRKFKKMLEKLFKIMKINGNFLKKEEIIEKSMKAFVMKKKIWKSIKRTQKNNKNFKILRELLVKMKN